MVVAAMDHLHAKYIVQEIDRIKFLALLGAVVFSIISRADLLADTRGRRALEQLQALLDPEQTWIGQSVEHIIGQVSQALQDPENTDLIKMNLVVHFVHYFWHRWGVPALPTDDGPSVLVRVDEETPWERFIRAAVSRGPPAGVASADQPPPPAPAGVASADQPGGLAGLLATAALSEIRRLRVRSRLPQDRPQYLDQRGLLISLAQVVYKFLDVEDARARPEWVEEHALVVTDLEGRMNLNTVQSGGIAREVAFIDRFIDELMTVGQSAEHTVQVCAHYITYVWDKYHLEPPAVGGMPDRERDEERARLSLVIGRMIRDAGRALVTHITQPTGVASADREEGAPPTGVASADREAASAVRVPMPEEVENAAEFMQRGSGSSCSATTWARPFRCRWTTSCSWCSSGCSCSTSSTWPGSLPTSRTRPP